VIGDYPRIRPIFCEENIFALRNKSFDRPFVKLENTIAKAIILILLCQRFK